MDNQEKEWIYTFVGGGWNSVIATTKEEAIKLAKEEWAEFEDLEIDEDSMHVPTTEGYFEVMRQFLQGD